MSQILARKLDDPNVRFGWTSKVGCGPASLSTFAQAETDPSDQPCLNGPPPACGADLARATLKLYLPRLSGTEAVDEERKPNLAAIKGFSGELVLVVDDEPAVRAFSVDALLELGYAVIDAGSAAEALTFLDTHPDVVLLFTDLVMPDQNGRKLAEAVRRRRPGLPVLFTTGYSRNAIVHNGVLDPDVQMIGKPFTVAEPGQRVREVLDEAERERAG